MLWFKGRHPMPDEEIDMEEQRASVFRLSDEMHDLSEELLRKARELKEELERARAESTGPRP